MQIDPNVMNQQMEEDRGQREGRYQKRTEFNQQQTEGFQDEPELAYDPGTPSWNQEGAYEESAPKQQPKRSKEEEVLPGLYDSDLISWRKQFGEIFLVKAKGEPFIIRPLERFEYKEIIGTPNTDPLMREEMMCEYCVLYPQQYDFTMMSGQKAGYPAILSEVIMEHSGFTKDVEVQRL